MEKLIRILIVEDMDEHFELLLRELSAQKVKFTHARAQTKEEFVKMLETFKPEIVISDYMLPTFDGMSAYRLTRDFDPALPFIIVTGSINEETAVACIKSGVSDYVLKEHLGRLGPTIRSAIHRKWAIQGLAEAEEKIRKGQRFLSNLIESLPGMTYQYLNDPEWTAEYVSESVYELTGYPARDFLEKKKMSFSALIHPDDRKKVWENSQRALKDKVPYELNYRIRTAQGEEKWVWERGKGIFDSDGKLLHLQGFVTDVTDKKRAEDALRQNDERLSEIIDNAPDPIVGLTSLGFIQSINPEAERISGYSRDEVVGKHFTKTNVLSPKSLTVAIKEFAALMAGQERPPFELECIRKNGEKIIYEANARILRKRGKPAGIQIIFRDLTERKRIQKEVELRVRQQQVVAELGQDALAGTDLQELMTKAAVRIAQTLEVEYSKVLELLPEGDRLRLVAGVGWKEGLVGKETVGAGLDSQAGYTLTSKSPVVVQDMRTEKRFTGPPLLHEHGVVSGMSVIIQGIGGKPFGVLGVHSTRSVTFTQQDVDFLQTVANILAISIQHRHDEREIKENEEKFRTLTSHAPVGIFLTDASGSCLFVNERWCQIAGMSPEKAKGQGWAAALHPDDYERVRQEWSGVVEGKTFASEYRFVSPQGKITWLSGSAVPLLDHSGKTVGYLGTVVDVTERRKLEDQLRQSQKMEAVGRLAGGIAHDFNNILTAITGYTELALKSQTSEAVHADLEEVYKAAERASSLTRQLLSFSRRQTVDAKIIEPNELILNMDKMLRRVIGEDIEFSINIGKGLKPVKADPGQLEQVIMNLAVNARDAISTGGRVLIETAFAQVKESFALQHEGGKPGDYSLILVKDTGQGMTEEVKKHLFEPFFTTKETGKGTGLGLATCYGIVKQAGGFIDIESEVGKGTTVTIYLPVAEEAVSAAPAEKAGDGGMPKGTEKVLLVDDEATVRSFTARILRRQGYTVLEASSGPEALALLDREPAKGLQLLFTDVMMPKMNGQELADKLRAVRPEVKVLFASGFTDEPVVRKGVEEWQMAFLAKPFSAEALARKVREVLDKGKHP